MQAGDLVRVISLPENLDDSLPLKTKALFEACLGRVFPIADFHRGLVALDVGELLQKQTCMETIYIEPSCLESVTSGQIS